MKAVLVGFGEVGKGLYNALLDHHKMEIQDPSLSLKADVTSCDVLLIAIPYNDGFVEAVKGYQREFSPEATVVHSSVPIGTSRACGAFHSPIEGRHDNMAESIRKHRRWIGGTKNQYHQVAHFFRSAGLKVILTEKPETTEFLKLASTTVYGINIEWARYMKEVADQIGFDYDLTMSYNYDYNSLVSDNMQLNYRRYNLEAPKGKIGGHCVLPNARLLQGVEGGNITSHAFIRELLRINETLETQGETAGPRWEE